jgi:hypothetical protein
MIRPVPGYRFKVPIDRHVVIFWVLGQMVRVELVPHGVRDSPAVSGLSGRVKSWLNRLNFEATCRALAIKHTARALHTCGRQVCNP